MVAGSTDEITPYKFDRDENNKPLNVKNIPAYDIPASARFMAPRAEQGAPEIIYYLSSPNATSYPIAIICGGSTSIENIGTIIHVHRYFLQEFMDLNVGVVTVEQWGVDGEKIDAGAFMEHYTRSQRLQDHKDLISHLVACPPQGWNGKLIFLGISEGGPLVTTLTAEYTAMTVATMNWVGAGDWPWRDELWIFIEDMRKNAPWWANLWDLMPRWLPFAPDLPRNRDEYDARIDEIAANPNMDRFFLGMSYKYHADTMEYPAPAYQKLRTPLQVVAGAQDSAVHSSDAFVQKAQEAGVNVTYLRVANMGHYVRTRPDIIKKSFDWLVEQMQIKSASKRE